MNIMLFFVEFKSKTENFNMHSVEFKSKTENFNMHSGKPFHIP